ncbi:MAG: 23S rRNA (adenine(2030)-N(6))-methyltransferase RlmJ [Phycisphaerales bacterium]|nr:23S rRNA (adenine(2030)-N(6))-methyltransferase RlmJ [Phycisphaerales bacterium]
MRVIAGRFRGLTLEPPAGNQTRPVTDRAKETIFNILGSRFGTPGLLPALDALDLFAGCGSFGIEALSRGAARCVFIEKDRRTLPILKSNIARLRCGEEARIGVGNVWTMRLHALMPARFGLVFVDPPYATTSDALRVVELLDRIAPALTDDGVIVLRLSATAPQPTNGAMRNAVCDDVRDLGTMRVLFLAKRPGADSGDASSLE